MYMYNFCKMATLAKYYIAIFSVWCFISTAFGKCGLNDFVIGTVRSGREIQGKSEWNVQVINTCNCSQSNIVLTCQGFQTVEPIDSSIFQKNGDRCSVNGGRPLRPQASVNFSYAWDPPFLLRPYSTHSLC